MNDNRSTFEVDFEPIGRRVRVARGTDLLEAARGAGIGLRSVCGGVGTCGRCRVVVTSGPVGPPTEADQQLFSQREIASGYRLACRCRVFGDLKLQVPKTSLLADQRLQVDGQTRSLEVKPIVRACAVALEPPTLQDPRADLQRIGEALASSHAIGNVSAEPALMQLISPLARESDWRLTVVVRDRSRAAEIIGVGGPARPPVGLAVDLGTTKIAGYLLDLETGKELASAGALNPQIRYGEDLISRLAYAGRDETCYGEIAGAIREELNRLVGTLADGARVGRAQIADGCMVGNTAMIHLLARLPVRQLAAAPFVAAVSAAFDLRARDLDLELAPGAYVHILPSIGGFVGADHVAMVMACDLDRLSVPALGIDIGTNTEIALHRPGEKRVISVSCASGPAFEGAHIRHGMRAASGAIEAVRISDRGIEVKTVGGTPAVGVCGSGLVDAVAEMYRAGIINRRGRMAVESRAVRKGPDGSEVVLVSRESSGTGADVVITQGDIAELQLAKSAIATGIDILIEATETDLNQIREVMVAGAFGSYLNLNNAMAIGLLPDLPRARYTQVGNAAGVGAKMALLSYQARARARRIAYRSTTVELTTYPGFSRRFTMSTRLPEKARAAAPLVPSDTAEEKP